MGPFVFNGFVATIFVAFFKVFLSFLIILLVVSDISFSSCLKVALPIYVIGKGG